MMDNQLPVLIVVLPLVAGLLMPFLGRGHIPWFFATVATWSVLGMATALLIQIYEKLAAAGSAQAVISYSMGGWKIPWGIEFRVDPLNAFMLLVIALVSAVVTVYARLSVAEGIPAERTRFFYALWLLFITGLLGVAVTGDL